MEGFSRLKRVQNNIEYYIDLRNDEIEGTIQLSRKTGTEK
jgi:hypothetical protein